MKIAVALFALALGAAIPLQDAAASGKGLGASLTTTSQGHDLSAAKRKKRGYVNVYPAYYGYYHAYPRAFSPGDPSYQSPELIRLRALNRCVVDLGYGRWENCD